MSTSTTSTFSLSASPTATVVTQTVAAIPQPPSPTPQGTYLDQRFQVADSSFEGLYVWIGIASLITLLALFLYEFLRRREIMQRVFYTRILLARDEAPPFPQGLFGWIKQVLINTNENYFIRNVGLDAVMFLRFVWIGFSFTGILMLLCLPVLVSVNYAADPEGTSYLTPEQDASRTNNKTNIVVGKILISKFSISNVPDGSGLLWLHLVYAYLITALIFFLFYRGLKGYSILASEYLKEDGVLASRASSWRKGEILQLRTVMIENLPDHLRCDRKLKEYFQSLGVGEVESAIVDRNIAPLVEKLWSQRNRVLHRLELSYVYWARNIDNLILRRQKLTGFSRLKWLLFSSKEAPIPYTPTTQELIECRPKLGSLKWYFEKDKDGNNDRDAIEYYAKKLETLSVQLQQKKLIAKEPSLYVEPNPMLCSYVGFVTFKSQRSAQIAAQTLVHSEPDPLKFQVRNAPSPRDVYWTGISLHPMKRYFLRHALTVLTFFLCFFIVVPTNSLIALLRLETLAKTGFLRDFAELMASNPRLKVLFEAIVPQLILGLVNNVIVPHSLIRISRMQSYRARSRIEMATMTKYFAFLFFNVFFVFSLADSFWSLITGFFKDSFTFFDTLAQKLPNGAAFFMNLIIFNIIYYSVELLRIVTTIFALASEKLITLTPRKLHENSMFVGYLDYGWLYPMNVLIFVIVISYSVIAPLILLPGFLYYGLGYLVFRNQMLYVYTKEWEAFGKHWVIAFKQSMVGIAVFQVTLLGIFALKNVTAQATLMAPLLLMTFFFSKFCLSSFSVRTKQVPLDQMPGSRDSITSSPLSRTSTSNGGIMSAFDSSTMEMLQSAREESALKAAVAELEQSQGHNSRLLQDVVYTPEQHVEERYSHSYMNPVFSKPLSRPWVPISHAKYFSQALEEAPVSVLIKDTENHGSSCQSLGVAPSTKPGSVHSDNELLTGDSNAS